MFTRSFTLPPGRYSLELVVLDQVAQRASVRKSVLVVPAPRPGLVLSSLAVVKRTEPVAEGALESRDPLRNGANRVVPFVGEPTLPGRARPCRCSSSRTRARATRRAPRSRA